MPSKLFCCYIGDCDESFGFSYYQNGKLVREYIVEDPRFEGGEVTKDFGKPFPNEAAIFKSYDILQQIVLMAKLVDIDIEHHLENIRSYRKLGDVPETFIFEESEY